MLPAVLVHMFRPAVLMLSPRTFVRSLPERVYRSDYSGHSDRTKVMQEGAQDNHLIINVRWRSRSAPLAMALAERGR